MANNDITDNRMGVLRRHLARLIEQEKATTEKLVLVLTDTEGQFISSFNGEDFLELPAVRRMITYLTLVLTRFDAGKIKFTDKEESPVVDATEFLRLVAEEQSKKVMNNQRTSFSTSVASNQMDAYAQKHAARVYEICAGW